MLRAEVTLRIHLPERTRQTDVLVCRGYCCGAGGAGAQVYTGRKRDSPAETELSFKLAQDLQMRPVRSTTKGGLKIKAA